MKKIAIAICLVMFTGLIMQAQNKDLKKLFDKYESVDGFSLKKVEPGIDIQSDEMNMMSNFLNDANELYILGFENTAGNQSDFKDFHTKLKKLIKKHDFVSVMEVSDEDDQVKIYMSKTGETLNDFLLITSEEDEATVIWASAS